MRPSRSVKNSADLQMHDAVVAALAQADVLHGRDLAALDRDELHLVFAVRITLLLNPDRLGDPFLAMLVPEMRNSSIGAWVMLSSSSSQHAIAASASPK